MVSKHPKSKFGWFQKLEDVLVFFLAQGAREVNQTSTKIKEGQTDFFHIYIYRIYMIMASPAT
jgi:hypothetical protein